VNEEALANWGLLRQIRLRSIWILPIIYIFQQLVKPKSRKKLMQTRTLSSPNHHNSANYAAVSAILRLLA
jgi:hypothetical protein